MKPRPWMLTTLAALAVLGCLDTASAQPQLIVSPANSAVNPLVFNNIPAGGLSLPEAVTVTTQNSTTATVIVQINPASTWLQVSPSASVNVPSTLNVQCNTTALNSGTYNGSFTITVDGAPTDQVTIYVSLTVAGISALSATPNNLQFSGQAGATSGSPSSSQVQISSDIAPLNYTVAVNYLQPSGNWLLLSASQGSTSGPPLTVSVNPSVVAATLYPAIFNANIVATSTSTSDSVVIAVQLTLNSNTTISVAPVNPPPFLYQIGTATDPPSQALTVTAAGGATTFSVQESPQVSWLTANPLNGTATANGANIILNATPHEQALQPGDYTTSIVVTPGGASALAPVPVSLLVSNNPLLKLSNNTLNFTVPFAGAPSATQQIIASSSSGQAIGFTATPNVPWLTATPNNATTPATISIRVSPAGLSIQSYTGTITVAPTNGDAYTETITVNLNVITPSQLIAGPSAVLFSYEIGKAPPNQQGVQISSTGDPLTFQLSTATSNCGPNWLTAGPVGGESTITLSIAVVPTGLQPGTCSGVVDVNYQSAIGPSTLAIPVTLIVSNSSLLTVNMAPNFGIASIPIGNGQFEQQIGLTSTDLSVPADFEASVMNVGGGAWLSVDNPSGSTPQTLNLRFSPGVLSIPGLYTGTLVINSNTWSGAQLTLQIALTVTTSTTVTLSATSVTFSQPQGASPPAAQSITLTASPGTATYTAVLGSITGGNWLQFSPASGNANGTVQFSILPNTLAQGQYTAQVSFTFQDSSNTSAIVSVTLNVTAPETVNVSPPSLVFNYQINTNTPQAQTLSITTNTGSAAVVVSTTSSGWLSVNGTGGTTPQTLSVSVNPSGLSASTYNGSISVSAPGLLSSPLSVPVTLNVTAAPGPVPITILNNATGVPAAISPGEELAIKGSYLGPLTPALFAVNSSGGVNNTLAGVQVLFDNIPGTPIYVSTSQINVMVPYEINGRLSTTMVVTYNGGSSAGFQLAVAAAAPGLFTNNFTGSGQVAALNQNFTYNGSSGSGFQAAPRGSVISLFGTGGGQTNPPSATGSVTPIPANASQLLNIANVTATVGGLPATVDFAGEAPGLITGVMQLNVTIPSGVTPGNAVPVTIAVNGISSPLGATIAVQ